MSSRQIIAAFINLAGSPVAGYRYTQETSPLVSQNQLIRQGAGPFTLLQGISPSGAIFSCLLRWVMPSCDCDLISPEIVFWLSVEFCANERRQTRHLAVLGTSTKISVNSAHLDEFSAAPVRIQQPPQIPQGLSLLPLPAKQRQISI